MCGTKVSFMYKILKVNRDYKFCLDGSYLKDGVRFPYREKVEIFIDGVLRNVESKWLALLAHYEVDFSSFKELASVQFYSCDSKVINLKCAHSVYHDELIECSPGFYRIPGYYGFCISRDGVVKSIKSNRVLKPAIGPYGYPYVNIKDPDKNK